MAAGPGRRHGRPRRSTWLRVHLPYVLVLCMVAGGLALVSINHFKRGSALIAAAALGAALARLLFDDVGLLAGRRKSTDVTIMVAFAISIAVVAWFVPGKPG
jgi:hypothetical protein